MKYDVFISYRREGGYDTAKHLYDLLTRDGYRVCFDIDTLRKGDFDKTLLSNIDCCKDFILIVDEKAFERTLDPAVAPENDWLRQELAHALKKDKNIIPVFLKSGNSFPPNLPDDIAGVTRKNGPLYNRYYFNDFYKRLKQDFLLSRSHTKNLLIGMLIFIVVIAVATGAYFLMKPLAVDSGAPVSPIDSVITVVESHDTIKSVKFPASENAQDPMFRDYDWLSEKKIERKDIAHLGLGSIEILRNAVYATHGYVFKTNLYLKDLFESFPWYEKAVAANAGKDLFDFSDVERHNLNVIIETENYLRKKSGMTPIDQTPLAKKSGSESNSNSIAYSGRIGKSNAEMTLSFDTKNKTVTGTYSYIRYTDAPRLVLSGTYNNGKITMTEMTADGQQTGKFSGTINSDLTTLDGKFTNLKDNDISDFRFSTK